MKQIAELLKPEEVQVSYDDNGAEKTDTFTISSIPAIQAQQILFAGMDAFRSQDFSRLSGSVTLELMKYVAHNGIVLENQALVNAHIQSAEILLVLQIKMAEKNFRFFGKEAFQKQLAALQTILLG